MKFSMMLMLLLFVIPFISAEIPSFVEDTLTIELHVESYDTIEKEVTLKIVFSSEEYGFNDEEYTIILNVTNDTDININSFQYGFLTDVPIEEINFTKEYIQCITDRASYNTAWNKCVVDLADCEEKYEGTNVTNCKESLDECTLTIKEKDLVFN